MEDQFELDFTDDEQIEAALDAITEAIQKDEGKTTIVNVMRYEQMQFAYAVLKRIAESMPDIAISYELYKPFKSMGHISLEGETLEIHDKKWFSRAAEFADNIEIYPLAKNRVRLTFTFHGITKPIE